MSAPMHPGLGPAVRVAIVAIVLSPLLLAIPRLGSSEIERALIAAPPPPVAALPDEDAGVRTPPSPLPNPTIGFAINCHHIGDLALYLKGVDAIADLGANTLIVLTPMYQKKATSTRIRVLDAKCPTEAQLKAIFDRAKHHRLTTILMPIVLIEKPGKKDWRGIIAPASWDDWWESYDGLIDRALRIADGGSVDVMSIGSELNSTEHQLDRWERIVGRVRDRFDGQITYSANWDRFDQVRLWPMVDIMSVSSYFELERSRPGAPESDLVAAWSPIRAALLSTASRWDRPLILSEIGYPSLPWANAHPWDYVAKDSLADHEAQARCWRAFFDAWTDTISDPESRLLGFCGYRWDPYHQGGDHDTGYGIMGKPAMTVIRDGIAGIRERAARADASGQK